jgi:secretion/DNA translocation related TadE-like protein
MTPDPPVGERGSATVWVMALAAVLAVVGAAVVLVGAATVARHRAETAADFAALAAAGRAAWGEAGGCELAAQVARANAARLLSCAIDEGAVVEVRVSVPVRLGRLGVVAASGRARAGPAAPP